MRTVQVGAPGRRGRAVAIGVVAAMVMASAVHAEPAPAAEDAPPGASLDGLLTLAHRLSPELAARALESEAAAAKAAAAGALDDPMLRITSDEDRDEHGRRLNMMIYEVEQEFPLGGKRELRRRVAEAEAEGVRGQARLASLELDARVKTAFAAYRRADRALLIQEEVHSLLRTVSQAARGRYAQGLGSQSDAIRAEVERSRLTLERETLERDRRAAMARLNALLARPAGSPLATPEGPRPLPDLADLARDDLFERARRNGPLLAAAEAAIAAAEGGRRLVGRNWYPDVSLGAAAIQREDGPEGYMLTAGLRLPLQWGLRQAQAREAAAQLGAARKRRDAALFEVQGAFEEALAGLEAARRTEAVAAVDLAPQATAAYRSTLVAYQLGRGDLAAVLEAARQVQDVQLERLAAEEQGQVALAELERVVGEAS